MVQLVSTLTFGLFSIIDSSNLPISACWFSLLAMNICSLLFLTYSLHKACFY